MNKIKKGIKKKIKGKKDPKEDDLFDPVQLAKYKKEKELLSASGVETTDGASSNLPSNSTKNEDDEEWQRFKLLTAGVDDILKKTSGDLDRIKSESYYQRKTYTSAQEPSNSGEPSKHSDASQGFSEISPVDQEKVVTKQWINLDKELESSPASQSEDVKSEPLIKVRFLKPCSVNTNTNRITLVTTRFRDGISAFGSPEKLKVPC